MPADSYTKLLVRATGADTDQTFEDKSATGHTVTAVGNCQTDTGVTGPFGGSEKTYLFDGTGDWLSCADHADWTIGTADFVIDFWIRFSSDPGTSGQTLFEGSNSNDYIRFNGNNLEASFASNGISKSWNPAGATWYHTSVLRSSSTLYLMIGGSEIGNEASFTDSINFTDVRIGGDTWPLGRSDASGANMTEFRISVGTDRGWSGGFTPPTAPYATGSRGNQVIWIA